MATAMILVTIFNYVFITLILVASTFQQQTFNLAEPELSVLNLHYDHCKRPMTFSWEKMKCECPAPLMRRGTKCLCGENCIYEETNHLYHEGKSSELPFYINEIFEEIDGELMEAEAADAGKNDTGEANPDIKEDEPKLDYLETDIPKPDIEEKVVTDFEEEDGVSDHFDENSGRRKRSPLHKNDSSLSFNPMLVHIQGRLFLVRPVSLSGLLRPQHQLILNRWYFDENFKILPHGKDKDIDSSRRSLRGKHRIFKLPYRTRAPDDEPIPPEHRMLYPRPRSSDNSHKTILKLRGRPAPQTYSNSIVAGSMAGSVNSGYDQAKGVVSSFRGTGALALGSGGGSAGSAAFTGLGKSDLVIASKGSKAHGEALVGEKSSGGTSTSSLLLGSGDVIAVNSLGGKGASSAAGFSTKYVAGGATAAFGPASASLSATPGKGSTSSSAAFKDGLNTVAAVTGEGKTIVESSAVGDPNQDVKKLKYLQKSPFQSKNIQVEPVQMDFQSFFE